MTKSTQATCAFVFGIVFLMVMLGIAIAIQALDLIVSTAKFDRVRSGATRAPTGASRTKRRERSRDRTPLC